ncbi:MXAN_5808 family serine peptidase [Candidatus Kuenenia sp.]|uniref:MXAN_5808 family serine peptidase n=1 Tax=Candidatus Kuenenia sp. TaxID=2499824 RepID=UPI00321FCC65
MRLKHPFKYVLIIIIISISSISGLFIVFNKTFGLEPHFENLSVKEDTEYKFRLPGIVLSYINRLYVDPDRIDNVEMIKGALDWQERVIPEVLVDYFEEKKIKTVTVDTVSKTFDLSEVRRTKDVFKVLQDALDFINKHREENVSLTASDVEYTAINGMLTQLDPHSIILPPKQFTEFKIGTTGKFGGLGMVVGIRDGVLTVISPIEGTPAAVAGIKAGDKIVEIDGESTVDMDLTESVGKLRGDPGSTVTLSVLKHKAVETKLFTLKREIIVIPTVESASIEGGYGYVRIRNFQDDTPQRLNEQLKQLNKINDKMKGLILDLRNNSGGLLDQAIKVSDKFLESGAIVVTVGPGGHPREVIDAKKTETDEELYPIVVLVDAGSASGAEIVAGALKENNRAIIVGDRTFGKGSVQQLIELMDGSALKLTIAKYLTPLFTDIQSFGITPDIQLVPVTVEKDNINLFHGITAIREEDLKKHLDDHHKEAFPFATLKYFHEIKEKKEDAVAGKETEVEPAEDEDPYKLPDFDKDFHVIFARKLLANASTWKKEEGFLQNSLSVIDAISEEEEKKIAQALDSLSIDWSEGINEGASATNVTFLTNPLNKRVKAGEKITLTVTIENTGDKPLYQLRGISSSKNGLYDKHEFIFGKIGKGSKKSHTKTIEIPKNSLDREDEITIKFEELNKNNPADLNFTVAIEALPQPLFAFSYQILDQVTNSSGKNNGDGIINKGENINLLVMVKNMGNGISEKTVVTLRNLSDKEVFVEKGRVEIGQLNPGEIKEAELTFNVKETIASNEFNVDIIISDSIFGAFLSNTLKFSVVAGAPQKLTASSKLLKINKNHIPLYGGMSFDSPVLSMMNEGTILRSDVSNPDWYRAELPNNRYGWVSAKDVTAVNNDAGKSSGELEMFIQRIPPTISMDGVPNILFGEEELSISALVKDDTHVKHAYVLVNNDKIFFKSNKHVSPRQKSSLKIDAKHSLKEGPNVITIVARDDHDLVSIKSFVATKGITVAKGM